MWVHGDCHLDNILLKEEMLTGIVDWGDMHKGDPALDIFVVFFLTKKDEEGFFSTYGPVDEACYQRAIHRAMLYTLILLEIWVKTERMLLILNLCPFFIFQFSLDLIRY